MRRLAIAVAVAAALGVPAAHAGGWATVTLAPPPAGLEAEETWTAQLTVLRHGVTPTDGAAPSITIRGESGSQTFRAKPAGTAGKYVAHVVFPIGGQVGLRGERRAGRDRLRRLADAHVLARRDRSGTGGGAAAFPSGRSPSALPCRSALGVRRRHEARSGGLHPRAEGVQERW